jgi:hypothetical protein
VRRDGKARWHSAGVSTNMETREPDRRIPRRYNTSDTAPLAHDKDPSCNG